MSNSSDWSEQIKAMAERKDLSLFLSNKKERDSLQRLIENRDKNKQIANNDIRNLCVILNCLSATLVLPNNKVVDECDTSVKVVEEDNSKMVSTIEADLKYIKNMYTYIDDIINRQLKSNKTNDLIAEKETNTVLKNDNCFVWIKDGTISKCTSCSKDFGIHCRNCGKIFCSSCSSNRTAIKGYTEKVRVCNECFQHIQGLITVNT